jgi:hypothetical protein
MFYFGSLDVQTNKTGEEVIQECLVIYIKEQKAVINFFCNLG